MSRRNRLPPAFRVVFERYEKMTGLYWERKRVLAEARKRKLKVKKMEKKTQDPAPTPKQPSP